MSNFTKVIIMLLILGSLTGIYTLIEPYLLMYKEITIENSNIPEAFNNTKIVLITDIHHGPFFSAKRLSGIVNEVNKLNPDIILLGGDYIHRDSKYIEPCFSILGKLKAIQGVYAVLGNHDHWEGAELTRVNMARVGIALIDNKSIWLNKDNERIKLGGVGDYIEDIPTIEPTISDTQKEDFVILLTHNPDFIENIKQIDAEKIDIVFAGHTHGGQVTLFGLYAPILPSENGQKYRSGTLEINNMKVIMSNGVGTITPPVRFFARPQIIVAILKNKE